MNHKVFAVYDNALKCFLKPFFCKTEQEARRSLIIEARNPESSINQFPQDYHLYYLGEYDDQSAKFIQSDGIHDEGTALSLMNTDNANEEEPKTS